MDACNRWSPVPSSVVGASIRALRLHGSLTAVIDYVAGQTLPDGEPNGEVVDYYD